MMPFMFSEKVPCRSPPQAANGEISKETLADKYYTGSTVKYKCTDGYHIIGSDENKCMDGKWLPPPTCVGKSFKVVFFFEATINLWESLKFQTRGKETLPFPY